MSSCVTDHTSHSNYIGAQNMGTTAPTITVDEVDVTSFNELVDFMNQVRATWNMASKDVKVSAGNTVNASDYNKVSSYGVRYKTATISATGSDSSGVALSPTMPTVSAGSSKITKTQFDSLLSSLAQKYCTSNYIVNHSNYSNHWSHDSHGSHGDHDNHDSHWSHASHDSHSNHDSHYDWDECGLDDDYTEADDCPYY